MTTPAVTPTNSPTRGVIGLVAAILGTALVAFSFVNGISSALDGNSDGAGGFVALFLLGAALVLIALALAIIRVIRGHARVLSIITIVVAAIPIGTAIYLISGA